MDLTILGLLLNFAGSCALAIETISGDYVRPGIYSAFYNKVHQFQGDYIPPKRIRLNSKEKRVLWWFILICSGFLFQILDFII